MKERGDVTVNDLYENLIAYITENQKAFYKTAYCYAKNKEGALDIVQDAICKALENYKSLKKMSAIKSWFYSILIHQALNYIKKEKREITMEATYFEVKEDAKTTISINENEELLELIFALPTKQKNVIILHFYNDFTLNEISKILKVNENTIKTCLYAGLKKLKKEIRREDYERN